MLRISKTTLIMGACISKSYLTPPLFPAAAPRERLGNQPYTKWKTFAHDLLHGYGGTRIKFTIELELLLTCANGTELTIISPMIFDGYVHTSSLCYYDMLIRIFMS